MSQADNGSSNGSWSRTGQAESGWRIDDVADTVDAICANIGQVIRGKDEPVRLVVLGVLSEGHVLIEDAPGVGKTSLAKALAASLTGTFGRVQFTPDLLPSDVVGMSIWNRGNDRFEFRPGPVFSNVLLADEINRASPKTQSALLESMAERQVTVDGTTYGLADPFVVLATQNPLEHEGTFPLPESQLDRFLLRVSIGYPDRRTELEILETHGAPEPVGALSPVVGIDAVSGLAKACRSVYVAPALRHYLVELADMTRHHSALRLGASPRALLALQRVAQARAAAERRDYVIPDDIKTLIPGVLGHRLVVTPDARLSGATSDQVLADIVRSVPVPSREHR